MTGVGSPDHPVDDHPEPADVWDADGEGDLDGDWDPDEVWDDAAWGEDEAHAWWHDEGGFRLSHLPALDGLRGLAILLTVAFHLKVLDGGFLGIDLFFVLSGFLITTLLLEEMAVSDRIDLKHFWVRRARRLLPAVLLVLLVVVAFSMFGENVEELTRTRKEAFATLIYLANWQAISAGSSYWESFLDPSPLRHTWSLAVEEQFYLVWPLLLFGVLALLRRRAERGRAAPGSGRLGDATPGVAVARVVLVLAPVLALASAAWMWRLYEPGSDPSRVYLGTDTRLAAIAMGAAVAALYQVHGPVRSTIGRGLLEIFAVVVLVGQAVAWVLVDGQTQQLYQGGLLVIGAGSALVIAAAVHPWTSVVARMLSFRPLQWFGLISYGWYLWHWPVIVALDESRTGLSGWPLVAVQFSAGLLLAVASTALIELPIRRGSFAHPRGGLLRLGAAAAVLVVLVASVPYLSRDGGGGERDLEADLAAAKATGGPRVLFLGDSLVAASADQFVTRTEATGAAAVTVAKPGCGIFAVDHDVRRDDFVRPLDCDEVLESWIDTTVSLAPDVTIVLRAGAANWDMEIDGDWYSPCDDAWQELNRVELRELLDGLGETGTEVVVATIPPPGEGQWLQPDSRERADCVNDMNREVAAASGASVLDLENWVCPGSQPCREEINGVPMRPDGLHFKGVSAEAAADWIVAKSFEVAGVPMPEPPAPSDTPASATSSVPAPG